MSTASRESQQPVTERRIRARVLAQLGALSPGVKVAIALAVAVNVVLAAAYVWSRPGQTTHVRFEARDRTFSAYVDGRLQSTAKFDAPAQGGVILTVEDTKGLPSLPKPSGIDSVRVTDLDSGDVLFSDDFSGPSSRSPSAAVATSLLQAQLDVHGGLLQAYAPPSVPAALFAEAAMRIDGPTWRNYAVDVTYRNLTTGIIRVRSADDGSGVEYGLRPFRHLDNRMSLFKAGVYSDNRNGPPVEAGKLETVRSMVAMALRPYPILLLLLFAATVAVTIAQFVPTPRFRRLRIRADLDPYRRWLAWGAVLVLAEAVFGLLLYYNYSYGSHMPHVPDEVSYIFQAKVLASGHLSAPPPPVLDSFQLGNPPLTVVNGGRWASLYPFGHPLMLAIGSRFGAMWVIPPLLGSMSIAMVFAIGRRLYNVRTGLLAAVLFAASPFFLMTASNFMSHNTATFYLLASILCLAYADRRPVLFAFLAGAFFGLVVNTRQLSGAALIPPFALLLLTFPLARGRHVAGAKQIASFAAGGALMLLAFLAYNYGTTGHFFASQGIQTGDNAIGFGGAHSVSAGLEHERTQLTYLVMMLSNWPVLIGFMFVLLPFVLGTRNRWDWFFLLTIAFLMGVYTLYFTDGFMHGPRYWYETTPLLLLLTARGADMAAEAIAGAASRLRGLVSGTQRPRHWAAIAVVYGFVLVLAFTGWQRWAFGSGASWRGDFAPFSAKELRGFNGINDQLTRQISDAAPHHALVLVGECTGWQCYGNVDWMNTPRLDGDIVYARDLAARNPLLFAAFPDRVVYYARYFPKAVFAPYTGAPLPDAVPAPGGEARRADSFPPPSVPTPTPVNPLDVIARDKQRQDGLAAAATALAQYRASHGVYPVAPNVQTLCVYPGDAGCALKDLLDPLPTDPSPEGIFWYQSPDGAHYTLFARFENAAPASACPSPIPEHLAKVDHLYCVSG